jgi:hypothetical protein
VSGHRSGAVLDCKLTFTDGLGKRTWLRLAAGAGLAAAASVGGTAVAETADIAVLRALDKVTARISTIEAPIGQPVTFGTLQIVARTCNKRPPEEPPEAAAFLHVEESRPNEVPVTVFRSWMFASSPAVSAMDHPIYDIWVLDCISSASTADSTEVDSSE